MGMEHLLRNEQRRLTQPSRWDENTDGDALRPEESDAPSLLDEEHSVDMHSLLEENALLRRMLVKMDLVLKKVCELK